MFDLVRKIAIPFFLSKVLRCRHKIDEIWLVSPWFSIIEKWLDYKDEIPRGFNTFSDKVKDEQIPVSIITRPPTSSNHVNFIKEFEKIDSVRIIFQPTLHAKIYICDNVKESFCMLGSPNFTIGSLSLIEIGIFIRGFSEGIDIIYDLVDTCKRISKLPGFSYYKERS